MNKLIKKVSLLTLLAALAFTFVACGDSPKSLAKQAYEVSEEATKLLKEGKDIAKLEEELKAIEAKAEALSEEDKKIYGDELQRLWIEKKK